MSIESIIQEKLTELRARLKAIRQSVIDTAEASPQMVTEHACIMACILLLERILSDANTA